MSALVLLVGSYSTSYSQEEFPTRMIGFLKVGQTVGISTRTESSTFLIVFKDKTAMEIRRDVEKRMTVDELRRKYDRVEQQAIELIRSHAETLKDDAPSATLSPRLEIGRVAPIRYAGVLHVGDDYVLLEYESGYRTAYSSNQFGRFVWDDGKPNLYVAEENRSDEGDRAQR